MPRHDLDPAERADIASRIARIVSDEAAHASGGDPSSARKIRRGVVRALQDMERHEADPKPTSGRCSRTRTQPGPVTLTEGKRIVFFLGAGASVPLGYPVSNGILPAIWSGLARDDEDGWRSWAGFQARGNRQADTRARAELQRYFSGESTSPASTGLKCT